MQIAQPQAHASSSSIYPRSYAYAPQPQQHPPPLQRSASSSRMPRQRSSSNDLAFHPYKPSKASNSSSSLSSSPPTATVVKQITFVDTTRQASGQDTLQQCRPKRKRITPEQLLKLTALFEQTDSPSYDARDKLGAEIGMTNREVQVWMQNRRAKVNRQRQAALAKELAERDAAAAAAANIPAPAPPQPSRETMSSGQHQWRFRPGAAAQQASQTAAYHAPSVAASMGPPSPRGAPPLLQLPIPPPQHQSPASRHAYPPQHQANPFPHPPSYASHPPYSPSAIFSPSASSPTHPSYFPMPSPSLAATPSLASPGSVTSSYFSRGDAPFTPATTISSPSNGFFRLTLDSPRMGHEVYEPNSPKPDEPEAPIHLAPIRNLHFRLRPGSSKANRPPHRRSISDSAAHAGFLPDAAPPTAAIASPAAPSPAKKTSNSPIRLPSLRGLLNDDRAASSSPPLGVASAPVSPTDAFHALPLPPSPSIFQVPHTVPLPSNPFPRPLARSASPASSSHAHPAAARSALGSSLPFPRQRPKLISRYSTLDIHHSPSLERDYRSLPSSRPGSRMRIDGESVGTSREASPSASEKAQVGLGMLCAAATEVSGCEKEERLAALQRMR
ncbi:hypothetical protein JCM8547_009351 [Rhodosporidiobolus lusitaniae]